MSAVTSVVDTLTKLSAVDLKIISEKILQLLQHRDGAFSDVFTNEPEKCPKCDSCHITKFGKDARGKQRYRCKGCAATFTATSFSVISNSHSDVNTWKKYIECLLKGTSLRKSAKECNISVPTAFLWRHKILHALQKDQDDRVLAGIVEIDELYISISYKGNHSKSSRFVMPRKAYKRGSDNKSQIGSKICVMCAFERNGQTYGEVLGKGQPTISMLTHAFSNRILNDSIVLSDKSIQIRNYFNNHTALEIIQFEAHTIRKGKWGPPEVRGSMHIQSVNNLHSRFRRFLRTYNGVATKYLNHYLSFFVWLENHKKANEFHPGNDILNHISKPNMYINSQDIVLLPVIPQVA